MTKPRILFMGTPEFAVAMLRALLAHDWPIAGVVTQPDRPVGRKRVLTPPPVKELALQVGLPVFQPERIKTPETLAELEALSPDVIVTAAYGQLLPVRLLQAAPLGALNVHASLLPKYRGGAPIQWSLINGERETGVTIMTMVKAMDAGPMWARVSVPIDDRITYGELHDRLAETGAALLVSSLPEILSGKIQSVEQDQSLATMAPTISRQDELLDFSQSSRDVHNRVRALSPRPGAFTYIRDKLVKIWYATPDHTWHGEASPGQFVGATTEGPIIACQTGAIIATRIQVEGKSVQSGTEFVRGQRELLDLRCLPQKTDNI